MTNIVLIGVGKLGSRHLQALSQINIKDTNLFVVDPSESAIATGKERLNEMPKNQNISSVKFFRSFEEINIDIINLAIVATTSEHRKSVINSLCSKYEIENLILEKFLFQDEKSFQEIEKLLKKNHINCWVNCPRRQWEIYKDLKRKLLGLKITQVDVIGTKWSIATSAIHFIDLISFLIEEDEYEVTSLNFGERLVPAYSVITGPRESKYIEFFGSMHGRFVNSTNFNFTCLEEDMPFSITLHTSLGCIIIYEELGKYFRIDSKQEELLFEELDLVMPYQSEVTNIIAEDILIRKDCPLTSYHESSRLHLPLLNAYLKYLNYLSSETIEICPIT